MLRDQVWIHVFRSDIVDFDIFPGYLCQLWIRQDGMCFSYTAFRAPIKYNFYSTDSFDYNMCITVLKEMAKTMQLCKGLKVCKATSTKLLEYYLWPVPVYRSKKCTILSAEDGKVQCTYCRRAQVYQKVAYKRKLEETPSRRLKRQCINSRAPISYLTPTSKRKRLSDGARMRRYFSAKVEKFVQSLVKSDALFDEEQDSEMTKIVQIVNHDYAEDVNQVIKDSTDKEVQRKAIRRIWKRDCEQSRQNDIIAFQKDQQNNVESNKGNRWSPITYRLALAVYARNASAYRALTSFGLMKLPSIHSVQKESQKYSQKQAISHQYLSEQEKKYNAFKEEVVKKGGKIPLGEGILIFDEVKVVDKLLWNTNSHTFIVLAMNESDYAYIKDICAENESTGKLLYCFYMPT